MNKRTRMTYLAEFKREAVARAQAGDRSVRGLEAELGLSPNLLRQWVRAYEAKGEGAFVSKGLSEKKGQGGEAAVEEGVRQLQQRVKRLEEERTILKKLRRESWLEGSRG